MKLIISGLRAVLVVPVLLVLLACGSKSDLYLPEADEPEPAEQANESENETSRKDGAQP